MTKLWSVRRLLASPARNLLLGAVYMLAVVAIGTACYVQQGWSLGDAIYMVVVTVYTVGYEEVRPIATPTLRAVTIALIVSGCTGMIFVTGALVQFFTLSQIQQFFGSRRMQTQIDQIDQHVIICGFGRIGMMLARELQVSGTPHVILERSSERCDQARGLGHLCRQGDATDEAVLKEAGIERARVLATVLPDDAANVFITLSARSLSAHLQIFARGEAPTTERKLLYAGANQVVMPTYIGAERIAELVLYPEMAKFIGSARMQEFQKEMRLLGLDLDMVTVAANSWAVGSTIEAIEREAERAFYIVGLNRRAGERISRPAPTLLLEAGDGLVLIGRGVEARQHYAMFG